MVLRRGTRCVEEFLEYWGENLPDLSERPEIAPESTRFWMMAVSDVSYSFFPNSDYVMHVCQDNPSASSSSKRRKKKRKRYPSAHHKLTGMKAMAVNKAIDYSISLNNWCVTFKDEDGVTVDLVTRCILCVWLHYISEMVRLRHFLKHVYVTSPNTPTSRLETRLRHFSKHAYVASYIS